VLARERIAALDITAVEAEVGEVLARNRVVEVFRLRKERAEAACRLKPMTLAPVTGLATVPKVPVLRICVVSIRSSGRSLKTVT